MPNRKFYVLHLPTDQVGPAGEEFEIQLVDSLGVTQAFGRIGRNDSQLELDGKAVPASVLIAAKQLSRGEGDFVDSMGTPVHPRDL